MRAWFSFVQIILADTCAARELPFWNTSRRRLRKTDSRHATRKQGVKTKYRHLFSTGAAQLGCQTFFTRASTPQETPPEWEWRLHPLHHPHG